MKQLFQDMKAGRVEVVDLPEPALQPGFLLVRNAYSVISPGTERMTVSAGRDSYLKTARARPDLVRRVIESVKQNGVKATYERVKSKLGEPMALGYSSAGVVQAVGPGVGDLFRPGIPVACAGAGYASHAEVVSVPVNLAAPVPEGVDLEHAAFATLGAIALHGVRQGAPTLGERFGVIGLGIIGLLAVQLLRACGVRVAAFDLAPDLVERARALGAETGAAGGSDEQVQTSMAWTGGAGLDGVLVTAASKSDAPMVAAAGMSRDRGRVVAVGFVPYGLPREVAYHKELDLRISRSYGPGRYDPSFEEGGADYPLGYVRWTETRNLEAFLDLLKDGRLELDSLITHRYDLERATEAYDKLLKDDGDRPIGMVLRYPERADEPEALPRAAPKPEAKQAGRASVGLLGAGSFAKSVLLPRFRECDGFRFRRVVTGRGLSAHDVQRKFGFEEAGTDPQQVFEDPEVNLVAILTRHDLHADFVVRALEAGKHVFVEKPLALTEDELQAVERAEAASPGFVLVGFNRRFAPMARAVREAFATRGPLLMTCRVNAGEIPATHWLNDPRQGGGRWLGEGCHFVDLLSYLAGDPDIVRVQTIVAPAGRPVAENFGVQLEFAGGSVGQILYTSLGDRGVPKERIEVHGGGASAIVDDWQDCRILKAGAATRVKQSGKGHLQEAQALLAAVRGGGPSPIPMAVLSRVTRATIQAHPLLSGVHEHRVP